MIKEIDPNHPTMTAESVPSNGYAFGFIRYDLSSIDVMGYNTFKNVNRIYSQIYGKKGWKRAYIVSEWGPNGHWETKDTEWGAPKEPSMSDKINQMKGHWETINKDSVYFLGSYAFYWGFKYEITDTWFSMFSKEGYKSGQVNFLKDAWTGKKAENQAPVITDMYIEPGNKFDNVYLKANSIYTAKVHALDPEMDTLRYKWEIWQEDFEYYTKGMYQHNMDYGPATFDWTLS
jgi:hypothetical protein